MKKAGYYHFKYSIMIIISLLILTYPAPEKSFAQGGPPPYPAPSLDPGSLTDDEINLMKHALSSIMMDWDDMSFKKDYVDDPFRLDVVQNALDDPPSLIDWNYDWDAFLLEPKSVSDILKKSSVDLDSDVKGKFLESSGTMAVSKRIVQHNIPEKWFAPLQNLDFAVENASFRMESMVLGSLTQEDRDFLPSYLECHFTHGKYAKELNCPEEEAYGALPEYLDAMQHFDISSLLVTAMELSDEAYSVIERLTGITDVKDKPAFHEPIEIEGFSGKILIGTLGNDVWQMDYWGNPSILIDPGGDDVYHGGIGVAGNLEGEDNPVVSVVIDLAGNDIYLGGKNRSNGSGILGIAMHFDISGNDTYRANKFSQGCGLFGVGILEDREGDDIYDADLLVQGAGAIGVGLLKDDSGCDNYHAAFYAQGFGYTRGWGMLTDRDGYDNYYAGGKYDSWPTWGPYILSCSQGYAFGIRPAASGGIGILHDRNGKDFYSAEVFSQGGSYWYGVGAMIDDNGDDKYTAQVYSQGAGVHLSTGIIIDRAGNDNYTCDNQSQGFAHDFSVGWLIDEGGNDNYSAKTNAQGCPVTNSVAGLIDRAGNDGYLCWGDTKGSGYGGTTRGYGNIGIQLDMQGKDIYSYDYAYDGAWWTIQSWYAGVDVGDDWWEIEKDEEGNEISRKLIIPGVD